MQSSNHFHLQPDDEDCRCVSSLKKLKIEFSSFSSHTDTNVDCYFGDARTSIACITVIARANSVLFRSLAAHETNYILFTSSSQIYWATRKVTWISIDMRDASVAMWWLSIRSAFKVTAPSMYRVHRTPVKHMMWSVASLARPVCQLRFPWLSTECACWVTRAPRQPASQHSFAAFSQQFRPWYDIGYISCVMQVFLLVLQFRTNEIGECFTWSPQCAYCTIDDEIVFLAFVFVHRLVTLSELTGWRCGQRLLRWHICDVVFSNDF